MSIRLSYWTVASQANRALLQLSRQARESGLQRDLLHLVDLRVSQINGCAYCVDLHFREAMDAGEDPRRLNAVAAWQEAPFFTDRERAALAWAESLTRVEQTGAPEAVFEQLRAEFDDADLANLTFAIAAINAWNRLSIGFRRPPEA